MINLANELKDNKYYLEVINEYVEKERSTSSSFRPEEIQKRLLTNYGFDIPRLVRIPKSKGVDLRDIYVFNEDDSFALKVINKILCKNLNHIINDNVFSYRKGVRCFNAAEKIQEGLCSSNVVAAKVDISNFFLSINKDKIIKSINEIVEDSYGRELLNKVFDISSYEYKGEICNQYLGIMPGSALSSFFANYILKDVDEEIEKMCHVYARYSDDILILSESNEELLRVIGNLKTMLIDYGLIIKDSKTKFYKKDEVIEFLGLKITKECIDISDDTFKSTKKLIKKICDRQRKEDSLRGKRKSEVSLRHTINLINTTMYKGILRDVNEHKGGRARYIFGSVTTDKTLKEIDFYTKDRLRFVYRGKNNNAYNSIITNDYLEGLGWKSMVQLYNLYKIDLDIYKNEVDLLNYKLQRKIEYQPKYRLTDDSKVDGIIIANSFSDLYYELIDNKGEFVFNSIIVKPEDIEFNLETKEIYFEMSRDKRIVIYSGREFLINEFKIALNSRILICKIKNNVLSSLLDRDKNILLELYIKACYKDDYSFKSSNRVTDKIKFFRNYKLNQVFSYYDSEFLEVEIPYKIRYNRFLSYVFFHLNSGILWDEVNYFRNFIKIKNNVVSLILKREWL